MLKKKPKYRQFKSGICTNLQNKSEQLGVNIHLLTSSWGHSHNYKYAYFNLRKT